MSEVESTAAVGASDELMGWVRPRGTPPAAALVLAAIVAGCPSSDPGGGGADGPAASSESACSDGIDDDGDGAADCDDPDCSSSPDCETGDVEATVEAVPHGPRPDGSGFEEALPELRWPAEAADYLGLADTPIHAASKLQGGAAVADVDGDGYLDILATENWRTPRAFLGRGGFEFEPTSWTGLGFAAPDEHVVGVSAADADGDGDIDVFVFGLHNRLYLREQGTFVDRTEFLGPLPEDQYSTTVSWVDGDLDGDLDIYVPQYAQPLGEYMPMRDWYLEREDDGRYRDRIERVLDPADDGEGWIGAWFHADEDPWPDLLLVQTMEFEGEQWTTFVRGDAGSFASDHDSELHHPGRCMGVGIGDWDADGDFDVHVTDIGPTFLAENRGGVFVDVSTQMVGPGVPMPQEFSWGSCFLDVDNDGQLELFVAMGLDPRAATNDDWDQVAEPPMQPDRLWVRGDGGQWTDHAEELGVAEPHTTRSCVPVDLDRDGCVDLVVSTLLDGLRVHRGRCGEGSSFGVRLRQPGGNSAAIGAVVEAWVDGQRRAVAAVEVGSTGLFGSGPAELHLGVGGAAEADLRVRWPDGAVSWLRDVATNHFLTISRQP